ncbi:hypothetical protein F4813DRAFT_392483 [Daldinia decipiens]|uniref:uncharacterized protein n=1 Tax=Daldinia decipiens TaxID=326647 RepID=UPI0020C27158|nr:uncharacterized protein F4813DRAFT_392483 [Daldinia decipiens]KAI1654728.1 hypothetical protein F4813DRAFT_392483 [Daldinia decipiens]
MATRAWLDAKAHSVEGHTKQCVLTYDEKTIWGPASCNSNTTQLRDALHKADSRFNMIFTDKPKTVEGHTASISVSAGGILYLDKLSTHENMAGLCKAVHDAQQVRGFRSIYLPRHCPVKFSEDKADAAPPSQPPSRLLPCISIRIVLAPILRFNRFASGDGVMKSGLRRGWIVAKQRVIVF